MTRLHYEDEEDLGEGQSLDAKQARETRMTKTISQGLTRAT